MDFDDMDQRMDIVDDVWLQRRNAWIAVGIKEGFASAPCCALCDGFSITEEEDNELSENGMDAVCIYVMRMYQDSFEKIGCEEHHAPTVWRKSDWVPSED